MIRINFYLDKAMSAKRCKEIFASTDVQSKKETKRQIENTQLSLFVYVRNSGETIKAYVDRKLTQKEWDFDKQRANPNTYRKGARELNSYLQQLENTVGATWEVLNQQSIKMGSLHVRDIIAKLNNRNSVGNNITVESAFDEYIENKETTCTASSICKLHTTKAHLTAFAKYSRTTLRFEGFNLEFEGQFRTYLLREAGLSNNTIANYFKKLKSFLNFATFERNYNSKLNLDYKKYKSAQQDGEVYALTRSELKKLYEYEFRNPAYARVRDCFCFCAFTGLRFSDIENLSWDNVKGDCIDFVTKKTRESTRIPLNEFANAILDKYGDQTKPLPVISNQKTNEHLHEIGKELGFNEKVKIVRFMGSERKITYVPKYAVLTTHIARKTFITTSLEMGMPERQVRDFSGHKSDKNFRKYVSFSDTYRKEIMNGIWNTQRLNGVHQ